MSQQSTEDQIFPPQGPRKQLLVMHAQGESRYDTRNFTVDDKSAVLLVLTDGPPGRVETIAAFNREFWIAAMFVDAVEEVAHDAEGR
ncbi:hypothetical protein CH298_13420 [Rhodococcoides fascians]|uniref:hypothetical protein n=1 Tax=Rhodococcoides fascians TaxID=1828 RepID=UPI000B9B86D2|nr:hypothetical protein [Rhodococcus fascians]OZE89977.1 hypothetical protein CH303_13300 [Rhodococcus fascians]OZF18284.1 hypothetical protein CH298_13420 [Rhodococcus fascians]OZF21735.1 hypothetical protein CH297_13315 [Rhodococcus fascians]OZF67360.1 hypothetical protein CH308_13215 [Rhodococcus fascians]OZF70550.1 hypothetical protein CH307_13410 [Rhodococcus fascians]